MSHRLVRHPVFLLIALHVAMAVGAIFVSSTVQAFLVGTSWLGLESPPGIVLSVVCSILAMAAVTVIAFLVVSVLGGPDDDGGTDDDPPPEPEGPEGEPDWWPEFERELASYLSERERSRSPSKTYATIA